MTLTKSLVTAAALATLSFGAAAQTNWNMATPYPEAEFHTKNIQQFVADVNKLSGGDLTIKVHSAQSLFKHPEIPRAVRTGQVEIGETLMANLSNQSPVFQVDAIPFLVDGYASAKKLWQGQRPFVEKYLQDNGMRLIYAIPWPGQGFYTSKEIQSIADMEGVKFRTYNSTTEKMATLMKAVPTTVEAVEIPQAFTAGIVNAMVTSAATGVRTEAWTFSNYYYDTQAWMPKNMIYVNEAAFKRLSPKAQQALIDAGKSAEERGWKMSEEVFTETTNTLKSKMQYRQPNEALTKALAQIGDVMSADWAQAVGADADKILAPLR
ncbi:TRAP transporter substrate-binding protein [Orrella daihaiensis]|uniref:TRAP transporter substrate-binding protein n=1 Tax=Orrella daihaiensis TaxID=2782176 RepID=A0ABY4AHN9_9BURK|nr:TRAP transporter substrate-binding protein [Orrella daihaiensis]UOD49797.1 TRAP transporter substrate-binding protein [Orrella daihaiensis]